MFLASLSYEQRKVFFGLTKEILVADDDIINSHEGDYLRSLCSEMSLSFSDEMIVEKSKIKEIFHERESKKILLLELVALAHSNNNYHEKQDSYTDEICNLIGFSIDELREVEALLSKFNEVQSQLIEFVEG